jgi:hypothetical protein
MRRPAAVVLALSLASAARADVAAPEVSSSVAPDVRAFWPDVGAARFRVQLRGQFSTRARFDVNTINGPPVGGPREPPPASVPHLAAMNRELPGAIDETLRGLGLSFQRTDRPPDGVRALTVEPGGDVDLQLIIEIGGDNGLGGHYGGTDVRARLKSFHRAEQHLDGWALTPLELSRDEKSQLATMRVALRSSVLGALRDFRAHLTRPLVALDLSFDAAGLDGPQRAFVRSSVPACAIDKLVPVDVKRQGDTFTVTLRRGRWEPESEDQLVEWAAGQLPSISSGKGEGCLAHGPLDGWRASVRRSGPRALTVSFSRP